MFARRLLAPALLALVAAGGTAGAQDRRDILLDGEGNEHRIPPRNTGFGLFANADLAGTGMKMTGQFGWGLTNIGPCADGFQIFECGDVFARGAWRFQLFELTLVAGVPTSDFRKIRTVHPGVSSMLAPSGFSTIVTQILGTGRQEWGPGDNSLGRLFSGVASTEDNSCRDNTSPANGWMSTGITLLAGLTCPETWAGSFQGQRPISDSAFIRAFQANPSEFSFDFWKIPESDRDNTQFLGDFSTYGEISDYFREILISYGGVTPQGSGPPAIGGFPLGIDIRFDAWSIARPQLANAVFYQMIVVNNSARVYGTGIDYDSLYMGFQPGFGGAQIDALYHLPHKNALFANDNGTNVNCNGARIPPGVGACAQTGVRGFSNGGMGFIMLKSPIGDHRNKKLTQPGPFFNPTSEFADDTITFNHGHMCGFGAACFNSTFAANDRRGFGMISSTHENVLDGRDPASLTGGTAYQTFRNEAYNGVSDASVTRFNRYVPGNWDYNEDGEPDTLFFDSCSTQGCVVPWSDTLPGKLNNRFSNVGGVMTTGPFRLGAGDTTSFLMAFIGAPDSAGFEALANDVIDAYMNFFVGPKAPPVPVVVATEVQSAAERDSTGDDPRVTIFFSDAPESYVDPFFAKFAADLRAGSNAFFRELNALNPNLADEIEERASANFAELWVFKSCDAGNTFTGDADCDGDPTIGPAGENVGLGWRPYRIIKADANGQIANSFVDDDVEGGRTYLYSFVTRSQGFTTAVRRKDPTDTSPECAADITQCETIAEMLTIADTATSALQRSGPTTARVYVPITAPAGAAPASFTLTTVGGVSTLPVTVRLTQRAVAGQYRLVFGNRFIVRIVTNESTGAVTSTVVVQDVVSSARQGTTDITNAVIDQDSLSGPGRLDFAGATFSPTETVVGQERIEVDTISAFGFVLARGSAPLFLSTDLTTDGTTPVSFTNRADFPGILVSLNQATSNTLTFERIIRANGDTTSVTLMNSNAVQFQEASSTRAFGRGIYTFTWSGDAFGPGAPFTLGTVPETEAAVVASLNARPAATTGATGAALEAAVLATDTIAFPAIKPFRNKALIPLKFPFTVTSSTGNQVILAGVDRTTIGGTNRVLLGNGADTARIDVPTDTWVPGDQFLIFQVMQVDSTVGGRVILDGSGAPIQVTDTVVAFGPTVLGCNSPRVTCNPVRFGTRGATGYLPYANGDRLVIEYPRPFTMASELAIDVTAAVATNTTLTKRDLDNVRVVPNPYVFQSDFDEVSSNRTGDPRIIFAGVPAEGKLRVYSVSGQFLQELTWTAADLNGTGDLPYNLRTREGTDLASGLYIYVLTARNANGREMTGRGKFVVIR